MHKNCRYLKGTHFLYDIFPMQFSSHGRLTLYKLYEDKSNFWNKYVVFVWFVKCKSGKEQYMTEQYLTKIKVLNKLSCTMIGGQKIILVF
jgi:hypothetical protein